MEEFKNELGKAKKVEDVFIENEMKSSFIDYAMSVIVSRAIPDARDGLKPIHRRILFAMGELDLFNSKAYKKSAKVVGEVLAKYHPHGDQAAYESLVRMAQKFSLRYPLIDGQGNFGSIDGDGAAAMRYTEVRLHKITELMLQDIDKNTVDFVDNYDASEKEPVVLPNKLPNLLINGSSGIAVGMATSIPPHNITEVLDALIFMANRIKNDEEVDPNDLLAFIKGPDFPTGGIILNPSEVKSSYLTGRGRAIMRSKIELIDRENKGGTIIVREIPYMVNKSSLVQKIVEVAKKKQITSISNVSDESNREGIRIVIKIKKDYDLNTEANKLFKLTPLQSTFSINLLALDGHFPRVLNLKELLQIHINHQIDVLIRKTTFLLDKAESRIHILYGLQLALESIDEVIELIKKSPSRRDALLGLIDRFNLSEKQADAILEMKLSRLTALEAEKLANEINELVIEIQNHKDLLGSKQIQISTIIDDLEQIKSKFKDERRTKINDIDILNMEDIDFVEQKDIVITMTEEGYIKRVPIDEYKAQNRGGIGQKTITTKENDAVKNLIIANTHSKILLFTNFGRVYRLEAFRIIEATKTAKGKPVVNYIAKEDMKPNEKIDFILKEGSINDDELLFFTKNGKVKKTPLLEFIKINRTGKIAISIAEGDELIGVLSVNKSDEYDIIIGSSEGKMVRFESSQIRSLGRTSMGVGGIKIAPGHKVVGYSTSFSGRYVLSLSENGFGKLTELSNFTRTRRNAKGTLAQNQKRAGNLISLTAAQGDEDLLIITNKGTTIRTSLKNVNVISRNSKGVTIVKLRPEEYISKSTLIIDVEEDGFFRNEDGTVENPIIIEDNFNDVEDNLNDIEE